MNLNWISIRINPKIHTHDRCRRSQTVTPSWKYQKIIRTINIAEAINLNQKEIG